MAGCNCHRTLRVLKRLGATHAARMEAAGSHENVQEWSLQDWDKHFEEEERHLLPRLPRAVANRLYQDHQRFRKQMKDMGRLDPADIGRHARAEDDIVKKYFPEW